MRSHFGRTLAGVSLTILGLAVVLVELGRYWLDDHAIHPTPMITGGSIALFGAYVLDPKTTRGGGNLIAGLAERGVRIVAFWKWGKRADDVVAITSEGKALPVAAGVMVTHPSIPDVELPPPEGKP